MQPLTSFNPAALLVRTAKSPFVNNWVELFSKFTSIESSRFGVEGPSFEDRVVLTSKFVVGGNITRPVFPDGVCGEVLVLLILISLGAWICAAFAQWKKLATD